MDDANVTDRNDVDGWWCPNNHSIADEEDDDVSGLAAGLWAATVAKQQRWRENGEGWEKGAGRRGSADSGCALLLAVVSLVGFVGRCGAVSPP
jgi:hypothetical protein